MEVMLAYGRNGLKVSLPDTNVTVIEPEYIPGLADEAAALRDAMRAPIEAAPLRESVRANDTVAIVVCDITRAMPTSRVLPVLLDEIKHVPREQITIINATGTHRAQTPAELDRLLGAEIARNYRVVNHDCTGDASLQYIGTVESVGGTINARICRDWVDAGFRIATGFIEPHFFAGFSGGPKMVAPGQASLDTIMILHNAKMIGHPNAVWGITEGNPIHDAVRAVARLCPPHFNLNVSLNKDHGITGVYAGDLWASHAAGCADVKRVSMRPFPEPFDIVISTNSGYPLDQNLYQAVKGMSAAARVVKEGGTIIMASECSDGLPEHGDYKNILQMRPTAEALLDMIESPGFHRQDQWQVQIQSMIQRRAQVMLKADGLTHEQIRMAHLEPVDSVEAAVAAALKRHGPAARICVLPQGPQTIPYVEARVLEAV